MDFGWRKRRLRSRRLLWVPRQYVRGELLDAQRSKGLGKAGYFEISGLSTLVWTSYVSAIGRALR